MSEEIETLFQTSFNQAIREERHRAEKLKQGTHRIPIAHLMCHCGNPLKDKLTNGLLLSSYHSFETFMFGFFFEDPEGNHQEIETIKQKAVWRKEHPAAALLEHLTENRPVFTVKDIIECLEKAALYRIIASFDAQSLESLITHVSSHKKKMCCRVHLNDGSSHGVPRPPYSAYLATDPNRWRGNARTVAKRACRGVILLTFLEDGKEHAMKVKESLEKPFGKMELSYIVYTLSDFKKYILKDFTSNILWIMSQVDYIVPILTEDYFKMLVDETAVESSSFDGMYAPYISRILQANWASNFTNDRTRCLKPRGVKWTSKLICPLFLTAVTEVSNLPEILIKSKNS